LSPFISKNGTTLLFNTKVQTQQQKTSPWNNISTSTSPQLPNVALNFCGGGNGKGGGDDGGDGVGMAVAVGVAVVVAVALTRAKAVAVAVARGVVRAVAVMVAVVVMRAAVSMAIVLAAVVGSSGSGGRIPFVQKDNTYHNSMKNQHPHAHVPSPNTPPNFPHFYC
jgi:hypothetical protein